MRQKAEFHAARALYRRERPVSTSAVDSDRPFGVTRLASLKQALVQTTDTPPHVPPAGAMTSSVGK